MQPGLTFLSSSLYWAFTLYGLLPLTVVYFLLLAWNNPGKWSESVVSCVFFLVFSALVGNSIAYFLNAIGVIFEVHRLGIPFLIAWIFCFSVMNVVLALLPGKVQTQVFSPVSGIILGCVAAGIFVGVWHAGL